MVIEMYIDTQELTNNQSLIIIDDHGRRWDVEEALNRSASSSAGAGGHFVKPEVIVERWTIKLGESPAEIPHDLTKVLPRTYKDTVVLFRALYSSLKLIPGWKFGKRIFKDRSSLKAPKLKYRILEGPHTNRALKYDQLTMPLFETRDDILEYFAFDPIDSPAGALSVEVTYRLHCDFRIDDSEAFLSSRFMGMDEDHFEPSLGRRQGVSREERRLPRRRVTEIGSLPSNKRGNSGPSEPGQAYGSLSTFHQAGPPISTSPLSALRAARVAGSESPEEMMPKKAPPNTRSAQGSRSSLRSADGAPGIGRRPSVSFMPFKSPSLSASPSQTEQMLTSARASYGKSSPLAALAEARAPASLSPYGSAPSRGLTNPADQAVLSSLSTSPKPSQPHRFSSSFGHRKSKLSTGGSSRTEDENSSGKASVTSSNNQPGSGVLAEVGGASSGSIQTDDDNISDFIKMLDRKKDLKSFNTANEAAAEASTKRTSAALSKFQRMKDSNDVLSNSMYSSLHLHRSSSSSSRQLSSVPPMVAGTSMSTSSSPGKPVSPHTPHTPTIPSRLSANSTIDYSHRSSSQDTNHQSQSGGRDRHHNADVACDSTPGAINIPSSPRPFHPSYRRSSSAAHQVRTAQYEDDDIFPFGMRSASLGVDDERQPLSLSALAGNQHNTHDESAVAAASVEDRDSLFGALFNPSSSEDNPADRKSSFGGREDGSSFPARGVYRPRIGRGSGRGSTPPQGSSSSLLDRASGSGASSDIRGGRLSFTRPPSNYEDDEPLLFAMSDLSAVQQSRRSLEEARGGGDSTASSRRASRRSGF